MPTRITQPWPQNGAKELVVLPQITARLRCSRRHFLRLVERGLAPKPLKLGTLLRWRQETIEIWIAAGCTMPRSDAQANG